MSLFKIYDDADVNWRSFFLIFIIIVLFIILIFRLFFLQIVSHERYESISKQNAFKYRQLTPERGLIFDKEDKVIANNRVSYDLFIKPQDISFHKNNNINYNEFIESISDIIRIENKEFILSKLNQAKPYEKVLLKKDLNNEELNNLMLHKKYLPDINLEAKNIRNYPHNGIFTSFLGYVGNTNSDDLKKPYVVRNSNVGKSGVEKIYDSSLYGSFGVDEVVLNSFQQQVSINHNKPTQKGKNLYTTIDYDLQSKAFELMKDRKGSVIAMDPNNGNLLSMLSVPIFDPNLFVNGISNDKYQQLQNNQSLFNRSIHGQYPPASTIKPFIGLSFLEGGFVESDTILWCGPYWQIPGKQKIYRDWVDEGHGDINLQQAISRSSDVFFYQVSYEAGFDYISDYLSIFGFGEKTGINLPYEKSGVNPNSEWKEENLNEPWYDGETIVNSIGQGYMLSTPLQLAYATSMLVNGGTLYYPNYIQDKEPEVKRKVEFNSNHLNLIKQGMYNVVNDKKGTAYNNIDSEYEIAGKTGTAQVFSTHGEQIDMKDVPENLKDHALFIGFAPFDNPEIVVAVIVENGEHGSSTAAPIVQEIIDTYLNKEKTKGENNVE